MKNDTLYFHTCGICSRLWPQHCTELVLTKLVYLTRGLSRLQLALLRFPCSRLRQSYFICSYVSGVIFMCPHCSMQGHYSDFVFIAKRNIWLGWGEGGQLRFQVLKSRNAAVAAACPCAAARWNHRMASDPSLALPSSYMTPKLH